MGLKDLFRKKESPTFVGALEPESAEVVTRFYLEFPSASGQPVFELKSSLSIGSEEAEAIVEHETISPKHCSFILNHGILSIIDHGGPSGTFINKKKIPTGKMIILDLKDKIKLGELECTVVKREESQLESVEEAPASDDSQAPETDEQDAEKIEATSEVPEVSFEEEVPETPKEDATAPVDIGLALERLNKEKPAHEVPRPETTTEETIKRAPVVAVSNAENDSSNAVVRIFGLSFDFLIVGCIYNIFSSFAEFNDAIQTLPMIFSESAEPVYQAVIEPLKLMTYESVPAIKQMVESIEPLIGGDFSFYMQVVLLVVLFRFLSSIVFGQSVGQYLAGIRAQGKFLRKRLLSIPRSIIGFVLLPLFFIFDFPTLFSKRSLKEVVSLTRLRTPSSLIAIVSILIFTPVLLALFFVSPLFRGLEVPTPVEVTTLKTVRLATYSPGEQVVSSKFFKVGYPVEHVAYALPRFKFSRRKGKLSLDPTINFVGKGGEEFILGVLKSLDLGVFLGDFVRSNPLASMNYPTIAQIVNDVSNTNNNFKSRSFPQETFVSELQRLTQRAFSLGELNVDSIAQTFESSGPFLGAYLSYRDRVSALFEQEPKKFSFRQIGDSLNLVAEYNQGRMQRVRFLPLNSKSTSLYQVSFPSSQNVETYQLMAFNQKTGPMSDDSILAFVDLLTSSELKKQDDLVLGLFQSVYGKYFEMSKLALESADAQMHKKIVESASDVLEILSKNAKSLALPEKISDKLSQNLSDLIFALKEKDMSFFGVNSVGVL